MWHVIVRTTDDREFSQPFPDEATARRWLAYLKDVAESACILKLSVDERVPPQEPPSPLDTPTDPVAPIPRSNDRPPLHQADMMRPDSDGTDTRSREAWAGMDPCGGLEIPGRDPGTDSARYEGHLSPAPGPSIPGGVPVPDKAFHDPYGVPLDPLA